MGTTGKCHKCGKTHRWDSSEIFILKNQISYGANGGMNGMKQKCGVICPNCQAKIIFSDEFNEGPMPTDNWSR
ncbi:hypothetical protein [Candidatus Lokiarchaeum ossiferum]|uniref:hypothetical protein n=1 Tax=Candidatus Lokiarchaeum ossiferum TaxID=2951803 RepID=UPI00352EDE23